MRSDTKKNKSPTQSNKSAASEARAYQATIAWSEEDQCYVASIPALHGCMSHGDTPEEAARNIMDAAEGWIETAREEGLTVPPAPQGLSGKFALRLPVSMHEDVARRAELDGISVNQWIVMAIARVLGVDRPKEITPQQSVALQVLAQVAGGRDPSPSLSTHFLQGRLTDREIGEMIRQTRRQREREEDDRAGTHADEEAKDRKPDARMR